MSMHKYTRIVAKHGSKREILVFKIRVIPTPLAPSIHVGRP